MGDTGDKVILYAAQADAVLKAIERDGRCFSREEYVRRKYGESGPNFLTVYKWFVKEAVKLVPRPEGAEFPYWSFMNLYSLDQSPGTRTLTLCVPRDEAVFFDMYDWNKINRHLHSLYQAGFPYGGYQEDLYVPRFRA